MRLEGRSVRESIRAAAVQLFAEYGYHAAPLRDIARLAGIQAASIYYHYANKQALLIEIMEISMQRLNTTLERIIQEERDPQQRLHRAMTNHIQLHTGYKAEFFIIDTEMRSLENEGREYIVSLRDRYESLLQEILRDGMERGVFRHIDVKVSSYAVIAMCTQTSSWFRPDGRLTVEQVVDIYTRIVEDGLVIAPATPRMPEESEHI